MARAVSRRELVFATLLGATGMIYMWARSGAPSAGMTPSVARVQAAAAVAPVVRMDLLAANGASFDARRDDLFRYGVRPAPVAFAPAPPRVVAPTNDVRAPVDVEPIAVAEPVRPPEPPAMNLTYTGFLGPKDDRCVALTSGDEQIVVKKGEVVQDQFLVLEIKGDTVVMGYTNPAFRGRTRELRLPAGSR